MLIRTFRKTAIERRRLHIDYSRWLEDTETLSTFQVTISPLTTVPLVVDVSYPDIAHKQLVMFAGSGEGDTDYTLQLVVTTSDGQTKRDDIGIRVKP